MSKFAIPAGWNLTHLGSVLKRVRTSVDVEPEKIYREIGIRSHGKGIFHKDECSGASLGDKSVFWIEPDCFILNIVFAWEQAVAKTTANEKGMISSHRFPMYKPVEGKLDLDYILYFFKTPFGKHLLSLASPGGAGRNKTLGQEDFQKLTIALPPYLEQRKIAKILSTWDDTILKTERLIAALRKRKKGLLQMLITGQVRFSGFENNWENYKLGELLKPIARKEKIEAHKQYSLIGVKWHVAGAHIHDVVPGDQIATDSLSRIEESDILYNKMWVTKNAFGIARKEHAGAYGSSEYPQFIPNPSKVDVNFLGFFFYDLRFQYNAHRLCKGTTGRARLNPDDFLEIEVRIPGIEEQIKIAEFLQTCENEIDLFSRKLEALKQQKKGLMQRLLTGEIRVRV